MRLMRMMSAAVLVGLSAGPALAQDAKVIERGKVVYEAQKCALCHSIAGKGNAKGPLDSVGGKLSAEDIRKWIVSPKEMKSATNRKPEMRAYPTLPAADVEALVAYMRSLKGA